MSQDSNGYDLGRSSLTMRAPGENLGITILGTEPSCGKTVFMAGLFGLLRQQKFSVRALKPVAFGKADRYQAELSFISSLTASPRNYPTILLPTGKFLSPSQWVASLALCMNQPDFVGVELPGSCASFLCMEGASNQSPEISKDCAAFARELRYPVIIVARHNMDAMEKLVSAINYAQKAGLTVMGTATVETKFGEGQEAGSFLTRLNLELLARLGVPVPYLGSIKFSPSISVPRGNQGNLIRLATDGLDLLTIYEATGLGVFKK